MNLFQYYFTITIFNKITFIIKYNLQNLNIYKITKLKKILKLKLSKFTNFINNKNNIYNKENIDNNLIKILYIEITKFINKVI